MSNLSNAIYIPTSEEKEPEVKDTIITESKVKSVDSGSTFYQRDISNIIIDDKNSPHIVDSLIVEELKEKVNKFTDLLINHKDENSSAVEIQAKYYKEIDRLAQDMGAIASSITINKLEEKKGELKDELSKQLPSLVQEVIKDNEKDKQPPVTTSKAQVQKIELDKSQQTVEVESSEPVEQERDSGNSGEFKEVQEEKQDKADTPIQTVIIESEKDDSLKEFKESISEFKDRSNFDFTTIVTEPVESIYNTILESVSDSFDYVLNDSYIGKTLADLPSFFGSFLESSVTSPVKQWIADNFSDLTVSVDQIGGVIADAKEIVSDYISDKISDALPDLGGKVADLAEDLREKVTDTIENILNPKKQGINNRTVYAADKHFTPAVTNIIKVQKEPLKYDSFEVIETQKRYEDIIGNDPDPNQNKRRKWSFKKEFQNLELSNELYWDITIKRHNTYASPDLMECFGLSENSRLPIISYDLVGEGISSQELDLYPGTSLIFPSQYNRPSKLTITIPEYVSRTENGKYLCVQRFKEEFINYSFYGSKWHESQNKTYSQSVRDFRECAYEITITKFSSNWVETRKFRYLGIPEVNISLRGSSSSNVEMVDLQFNIVGELFEDKPE